MSRVTQQSTVVASERQVSSDLGGEAVILQLESGVYHGLNAVGAAIWALLREPRTVEEIQESILAEFAVDAERCQRDVLALLRELEAAGLIEVLDAGRDKRNDART
ncbi:MAG TPA: PqqD family peptide modification chaperone [Gemmatimonadaceae bacterium]|nr:PqqD family peptide modification chaperone [Gemmatimonadaceae bacterium]